MTMKSIRKGFGIAVATCVVAATAAAFTFVETAKPETATSQQKPHNDIRRAKESNAAAPRVEQGQAIKIRIINGKNGHPLPKQPVSVSLLYEQSETKPEKYDAIQHLDTDANGVAQFSLPEPAPAHLGVVVRLTSEHWHCGCDAPALVVTKELIQKGIVKGRELSSPAKSVTAAPGEIVFVARPFTFFEALFYPLLKG
jgi:hypothetical protein